MSRGSTRMPGRFISSIVTRAWRLSSHPAPWRLGLALVGTILDFLDESCLALNETLPCLSHRDRAWQLLKLLLDVLLYPLVPQHSRRHHRCDDRNRDLHPREEGHALAPLLPEQGLLGAQELLVDGATLDSCQF